jgi:pSer/pThr/pTyr-binding forkhead associated (FHA) protein
MKIRVEIGDEITSYDFSETVITVGSTETSNIHLPYEGIGEKHLEILSKGDQFFVKELSSGEKTYLNGELVEPLTETEFNTFFPFEIGGILIYLENETIEGEEALEESLERLSKDITSSINLNKLNLTNENTKDEEESNSESIETSIIPGDRKYLEEKMNEGTLSESANALSAFTEVDIIDPLDALEKEIEESEVNSKVTEEEVLSSLEASYNKKNNKDKYKPDLFASSIGTASGTGSQSFKIKVPQTRSKTKINVSAENRKSGKRFRDKVNRKTKDSSLGSILILSMVFIVTGSVYYFNYYKKDLKKTAISKIIKDVKKFDIHTGTNPLMAPYASKYSFFANEKKCLTQLEESICDYFGGEAQLEEFEGAKKIADTLFIGISRSNLEKYSKRGLAFTEQEASQLENIVSTRYSDFFTYEQFKKNDNKATFKVYQFNYNQYKDISQISFLLFKKSFHKLLDKWPKTSKIHFFIFEEFQKRIKILSFVEFTQEVLKIELPNLEKNKFTIKLQLNSFLNEGVEKFYSSKWKTHLEEFNSKKLDVFKKQEKKKFYEAFFDRPNCYENKEKPLCEALKKVRKGNLTDGIIIENDTAYFLYDSNFSVNLNKEKYTSHKYSVFERKNLLKNSYQNVKDFDKNAFFKNDFILKEVDVDEFHINLLISSFLESDVIGELGKVKEVKKVVLLGFDYSENRTKQLKAFIEFIPGSISPTDTGTTKVYSLYFWRSKIPAFNSFLKSKAGEVKGFSGIQ